jgi:hypothetical protein
MAKKSNRGTGFGDFGSDVADAVRDRPVATAAVAAAAVGAGVFLWSRRNQISNQLTDLSNQIRDWGRSFPVSDDTGGFVETGETAGAGTTTRGTRTTRARRATRGMSETGGGTASLGARTGGAGTTGSVNGRGRAKSTTPQATR